MKERPILFSAPMVRAIFDGRKTQTRRVVNPQPNRDSVLNRMQSGYSDGRLRAVFEQDDEPNAYGIKCPYGQPGDRLWVRERWGLMCYHDSTDWCSGSVKGVPESELRERYTVEHAANWKLPIESAHWRPSIHMPRWASRITLEITGVRVERLKEITEEDAKKDGIRSLPGGGYGTDEPFSGENTARDAFRELWESINGPGSWDANPWVWVVEFRRI